MKQMFPTPMQKISILWKVVYDFANAKKELSPQLSISESSTNGGGETKTRMLVMRAMMSRRRRRCITCPAITFSQLPLWRHSAQNSGKKVIKIMLILTPSHPPAFPQLTFRPPTAPTPHNPPTAFS